MNRFEIDQSWFAKLIPKGITYPSSTIITGPAGSAKPIVGSIITASWLKKGGTAILLMLNSDRVYTESVLSHFQADIDKLKSNIIYIKFNLKTGSLRKVNNNEYIANLVKPEVWDKVLHLAENFPLKTEMGTLISASSLNMLLFSKTYRQLIFEKVKQIMVQTHCVFCITSNFFEQEMKQLERQADNLIYAHASGIMHLNLKIIRMKNVPFSDKEVRVPLSETELARQLQEEQKARQKYIPAIRRI
jgi:KaiC/GvpD/RAD55 family RecA-like ATPase